jgi:hypothetical protein
VLYACKGEHTLFIGQREREREKEIGREGGIYIYEERLECGRALCLQWCSHPLLWSEREMEGERERGRERDNEKERVRKRE